MMCPLSIYFNTRLFYKHVQNLNLPRNISRGKQVFYLIKIIISMYFDLHKKRLDPVLLSWPPTTSAIYLKPDEKNVLVSFALKLILR